MMKDHDNNGNGGGEKSNNRGGDGKFHFSIDRGGTFTDVHCILPNGDELVTKLLSEDPDNYKDAPTEGIRRLLKEYDDDTNNDYPRNQPVLTDKIGSIRMGTTVATNALLERKGERMGLLITKGFQDLLFIGNQSRPNIFDLTCQRPDLLYEQVIEIDERVMLANFFDDNNNTDYHTRDENGRAGYGPRVVGVTDEVVIDMKEPDLNVVKEQLLKLSRDGIESVAIVFMHSYTYNAHEQMVGKLAREMGCFTQVSCSSDVMSMVRMVPRGHTACAAAYLTPKITNYLRNFRSGFDSNLDTNVRLDFMKSDGGLTPVDDFGGHQAILSGPAGGVIGYAKTAYSSSSSDCNNYDNDGEGQAVIGFDMGGTSTDVSRYDGSLEHVFETTIAGVSIQAPQLDIHTVAAGGGSRLFLNDATGMLVVGPESAGAHPGPVCYRKHGGHLAVTDANLVLGRILPQHFPSIFGPNEDQPLHTEGAYESFQQLLLNSTNTEIHHMSVEELAYGFLKVANESMCRPIRNLTQMKGYDIANHKLACFGGAGPQHACAIAKALGMTHVFVHRYGGILSAYGLSMADAVRDEQEPTAQTYYSHNIANSKNFSNTSIDVSRENREQRLSVLADRAINALVQQGYDKSQIQTERYLNLRYQGTDNSIMIQEPSSTMYPNSQLPYADAFRAHYQREFGFVLEGRDILIDDYRVRAILPGPSPNSNTSMDSSSLAPSPSSPPPPAGTTRAYFENGWEDVSYYQIDDLKPGHRILGPTIIVQSISTIVLEVGCTAYVTINGDLDILLDNNTNSKSNNKNQHVSVLEDDISSSIPQMNIAASKLRAEDVVLDPVQLSIFSHRFMGIAEQMGRTLARTAISVNMKERLDFSCALFTVDGGLVANAPHIPVHLGAMQAAVQFQIKYWNSNGEGIHPGEALVSNHPQLAGGSHLPDITVITPVFHNDQLIFFVASRGHHADIGGIAPGSMPPHSKSLQEEGAMIVAFKLVKDGKFQEEAITELLQSPGKIPGNSGTRNLNDNLSDLRAQVAANNSGIRLLQSLVAEYGLHIVQAYMSFIQQNAEQAIRNMLMEFAKQHKTTRAHAVDHMDDGTKIELTIDIDPESGDTHFDFTGTGPQVMANHNAPPAVTYSAVIYSLRSLVGQDIPLNQGCLAPIRFTIPKYSLLNPSDDAGVVGGNVLTSQRVVDVVLRAFQACAASQGCMNNLTFGDDQFGYYETIAGGAGAGPTWDGQSGIHTHCTNTRITDPEIFERRYPVLLRKFIVRPNSGGKGHHPGGDGVIREMEPLRPLTMSILSERRTLQPYGMAGGQNGKCGQNLIIRKDGVIVNIGGRCSTSIDVGECLRIETPGGGGYGA